MHREIPDHLLKHVSPLSWEHINLTGIYTWDAEHQIPEGLPVAQTSGLVTPRRMTSCSIRP
ncbi:Tn3 family transposase [Mesorhizobium sp. M0847]